jgi:hypothetical protein
LLSENHETRHIYPATGRLVRGDIGPTTRRKKDLWIYQQQLNVPPRSSTPNQSENGESGSAWNDIFSFSELEYIPQDYEAMTINTTYRRSMFFNYRIAVARMVMAYEIPLILDASSAT